MKKLLSLLLAMVFLHSQASALSGGPVFGGVGSDPGAFVGTYSGVLSPESLEFESEDSDSGTSTSSVGLFNFGQPDVGPATGAAVIFIDGASFLCNLNGIIDPSTGDFRAVIDGISSFSVIQFVPQVTTTNGVQTVTFERQEFEVAASGNVDAEVVTGFSATSSTTGASFTNARVTGTASVDVFFNVSDNGTPIVDKTARFEVEGFRQSLESNPATFDFGSSFDNVGNTDNGNG